MQDTSDLFVKARTRQARRRLTTGLIAAIGGLVLMAFGGTLQVINIFGGTATQTLIVLAALILGGAIFLFGLFNVGRGLAVPRHDSLGARLSQALTPVLDARHTLVRASERDFYLIGPGGVMILSMVDEPGTFRCEGELWLKRVPGRDFQTWSYNPTREAIQALDALRDLLAHQRLGGVPIGAVVVFTQPGADISTRNPALEVTKLSLLPAYLQAGYLLQNRINNALLQRTRSALVGRNFLDTTV